MRTKCPVSRTVLFQSHVGNVTIEHSMSQVGISERSVMVTFIRKGDRVHVFASIFL